MNMNLDPPPPSAHSQPRLNRHSESEAESEQQIQTPSALKNAVARSCYSCNRNKVRCDKLAPCSSCTRSGKSCSYPPSGPRKRRSKKTIMAEMASRISSLEKSLAKATDEQKTGRSGPKTPLPSIEIEATNTTSPAQLERETHPGSLSERSREDVVVQKGSSSQYFNEILLSRIIEEERNIESVLTPPMTTTSLHLTVTPFNASGILSSPLPSQTPSYYHPTKVVAVKLWNIYVTNVEGCSGLKLLHLPTHELKVYSTIDEPTESSFENLALCLAIYFASTISLDDEESQAVLGHQDKCAHLLSFKAGLEQAFAQGDFLDRPTLTGLHALAIYLAALRVHNHGRGIWILNGLAIRIAESLGLHRNGERLGLSPFQSEIRRRLWWHLLSRDGRAGEDYGLENSKGLLLMCDVSLPLNVDDADLYPGMRELPPAKTGWTPMTFSLINIDLVKCTQKLASIAISSSPSSLSEDVRVQIIYETRARIEERLEHCNSVIPQHRLTLLCSRFLLRKLDFVTRQQWLSLRHAGPHEEFTSEENLIEALEILAPRLASEDDLLKQFAWARKAYPQYYVTMYILRHLCVKPQGPSVDRAWQAIDTVFACEQWDDFSSSGFASNLAVLAALRAKAVSVKKIQNRNDARNSDGDLDLDTDHGPFAIGTGPAHLLGDMGSEEFDFDFRSDEWPNWGNLAQVF